LVTSQVKGKGKGTGKKRSEKGKTSQESFLVTALAVKGIALSILLFGGRREGDRRKRRGAYCALKEGVVISSKNEQKV